MNLLRKSLFFCSCLFPIITFANNTDAQDEYVSLSCEVIVEKLETGQLNDTSLYDKCGFNDSELVWNKWAGIVYEKGWAKAIYEICVRYPNHEYVKRYCDRALQLSHPAALIAKGKELLSKNEYDEGYGYFKKALDSENITEKDSKHILETLGVYYYQKNDAKAYSYLNGAMKKGSLIARNILGYQYLKERDANLANEQTGMEYLWYAILKGCKSSEEIYGMFQLAKNEKISFERADNEIQKRLFSCDPVIMEKEGEISDHLFQCRCQTVFDIDERQREKNFILRKIDNQMVELEDNKTKNRYSVTKSDVLPNGATVAEIRKTAVILTYSDGRREILNIYQDNGCFDFCTKYGIKDNLSPEEMRLKIEGEVKKITIAPYHLTFTPAECGFVRYYADALLDKDENYIGKNECQNFEETADPILSKIGLSEEVNSTFAQPEKEVKVEPLSETEKKRLKKSLDAVLDF